ncbi:MAG: putative toxin-antitoxin system toxin component, PIN family [Clostridiales Family XIII bacterium]|jgi:putative PIN family toxin of toxin-antitoxin system|nr:putative toxin-antitoxin system toxin component, PIN family [Clostridiales Family XIII bacterium]
MITAGAVIDTNILVSAMLSIKSKPSQVVRLVLDEQLRLYYSEAILAEYQVVLARPHFDFNLDSVDALLESLIGLGVLIIPQTTDIAFIDESDRKFYDVAVTCDATLITGNRRHYPDAPFVRTPAEFLNDCKNRL